MSIEDEMIANEARRRGLSETQLRMLMATPDRLMADIAADARRSMARSSIIPAKPGAGGWDARPGVGINGWTPERPIGPPAGVAICDQMLDAQDARDRRERERGGR
jgi:hypothetical protein